MDEGISKEIFPGFVNTQLENCVFLPAKDKQNAIFSPNFTKPGKSALESLCTSDSSADMGEAVGASCVPKNWMSFMEAPSAANVHCARMPHHANTRIFADEMH